MPLVRRQTSRLRWGRVSLIGARYFVTICTHQRASVLTNTDTAQAILSTLARLHSDGDAVIFAATVMPDHVHFLFSLSGRLGVGQVMAKLKALSGRAVHRPMRWQENGFEHRLRPTESVEDYGFYIFMNPYAAELITPESIWPWWHCPDSTQFRFPQLLNAGGAPPHQWLRDVDDVSQRIIKS